MWNHSRSRIKPSSPALAGGSLSTVPPEKSLKGSFFLLPSETGLWHHTRRAFKHLKQYGSIMSHMSLIRDELYRVIVFMCREQGQRKVEKCLQTRLSTRAEHFLQRRRSAKNPLFVPVGKEHFLHTRMFLWFLKRNRPRDKTDTKLIRKFPKTKS